VLQAGAKTILSSGRFMMTGDDMKMSHQAEAITRATISVMELDRLMRFARSGGSLRGFHFSKNPDLSEYFSSRAKVSVTNVKILKITIQRLSNACTRYEGIKTLRQVKMTTHGKK